MILSAVVGTVLLASPAMAKTVRRHRAEPSTVYILSNARGSVAPRDIYFSDSLGHQSFPNPDRDFSIENLRSHPSG